MNDKNYMGMYSIYDSLANCYSAPFMDVNDNCAVRRVKHAYSDSALPTDGLSLHCVASVDMTTFEIEPIDPDRSKVVSLSSLFEDSSNE